MNPSTRSMAHSAISADLGPNDRIGWGRWWITSVAIDWQVRIDREGASIGPHS
jgi:hypothetical protein